MPSTSAKQRRFMAAAAHDPKFAKAANISQTVAREFFRADQEQSGKRRRDSVRKAVRTVRGQANG